MSSLTEFVEEFKEEVEYQFLPLFHSCSGVLAQKILRDNEIKATKCTVFDKNLLYFYYGKPAYPVSEKVMGRPNKTNSYMCPVCFVVNIEKVKALDIYPFDTGAFMHNLYNAFSIISDENELKNEYSLNDDKNILSEYISAIFSNNTNYISGESTLYLNGKYIYSESVGKKKKSELEPSIVKMVEMFNCIGDFDIDERSRTVELISDTSIKVLDSVEAVILPNNLLADKYVNHFFDINKNIKCITYCFRPLTRMDRYNEVVFQKAIDFMRDRGISVNE